jgi:hypothetical protein
MDDCGVNFALSLSIDASPAKNKSRSAIRAEIADAVAGYDSNLAVRPAAGIIVGLLVAFFGSGC